jgi:hypothetical protein
MKTKPSATTAHQRAVSTPVSNESSTPRSSISSVSSPPAVNRAPNVRHFTVDDSTGAAEGGPALGAANRVFVEWCFMALGRTIGHTAAPLYRPINRCVPLG